MPGVVVMTTTVEKPLALDLVKELLCQMYIKKNDTQHDSLICGSLLHPVYQRSVVDVRQCKCSEQSGRFQLGWLSGIVMRDRFGQERRKTLHHMPGVG